MKTTTASILLALAGGAALAQGAKRPTAPAPAPAAPAADRIDLESQKIIGNRELPKVLYIVPWKKPLPGDLSGRPGGGVLDEALAPIDRDVFRRQVQYDAQRAPKSEAASPGAAPARP